MIAPIIRSHLLPARCLALFGLILLFAFSSEAAARRERLPVASQWERYEVKLKSGVSYTNPVHQVMLGAVFISPQGDSYAVPGFWDGGKNWRVRFSPNTPGRWTYRTVCSDESNKGLHAQSGHFICSAPTGKSRFGEHGAVHVADGGRHLQHSDYTPFFWVGEAAWDAARLAKPNDWEFYTKVRASQKFNAIEWSLSPGKDYKGDTAYKGREQIEINLEFFQRMDEKIDLMNRRGLLSAIAPLWEIGVGADDVLPEDQAILLFRYALARWGSEKVAWIIAFEGDEAGGRVERWKRIGRAVFAGVARRPVLMLPGETPWVLDEFRGEQWVDVLGAQTARVLDEDSLQWLLTGPLTLERRKVPPRPLMTLAPPAENAPTAEAGKFLDAERTRRLLWWSALVNTPAGVSYSAQAVSRWDAAKRASRPGGRDDLPAWQNELFLPGARDIEALGEFFGSVKFWQLQPFGRAVVNQPGMNSPRQYIAAAGTEAGNLLVAYVPEAGSVEIEATAMPRSPSMTWVSTRDGNMKPALAVTKEKSFEFATPGEGDWCLVVRAGKVVGGNVAR